MGMVAKRVAVGRLRVEMEAERVEVMAAAGTAAVTEVVVRGAVRGAVRALAGTVEATKVAPAKVVVLRVVAAKKVAIGTGEGGAAMRVEEVKVAAKVEEGRWRKETEAATAEVEMASHEPRSAGATSEQHPFRVYAAIDATLPVRAHTPPPLREEERVLESHVATRHDRSAAEPCMSTPRRRVLEGR